MWSINARRMPTVRCASEPVLSKVALIICGIYNGKLIPHTVINNNNSGPKFQVALIGAENIFRTKNKG